MADEPNAAEVDEQVAAAAAEGADAGQEPEAPAPERQPRTADQVAAEMHRRYGKLEKMVTDLAGMIAQQQAVAQQTYQAPPQQQTEYSDEQLVALADQGNTQAQRMLAQREALKVVQTQQAGQQIVQQAQVRLAELLQAYPGLNDPNNPMTQEAARRKHQLAAAYRGVDATLANYLSTIQAIQDTCTYTDLATQARQPAGAPTGAEFARQSSAQTQSVMGGGSAPRRPPAPASRGGAPAQKYSFTPKEREIAARMGVDPQKARERFAKRHEDGRSAVTPTVAAFVRDQGGQL